MMRRGLIFFFIIFLHLFVIFSVLLVSSWSAAWTQGSEGGEAAERENV